MSAWRPERTSNGIGRSGSDCLMRRITLMACFLSALPVAAQALAPAAPVVSVQSSGAGAEATATIEIHATRDAVWRVLTSCAAAVKIIPGLRECEVQATAADRSWQRIRQVVDYSWYLPKISYVVVATYDRPNRIDFEQSAGDLAVLRGHWELQSAGGATVAHYGLRVVPGFWMPGWIVRLGLERKLPRMLGALRDLAETR